MADSLRLAGNAALGRSGVPAAMRLWRESYRHAAAIGDRAASAAAMVAIAAGHLRAGDLDSAKAYAVRGRKTAIGIGDFRTHGNAVGILATAEEAGGNTERALGLYAEASSVRQRSGDTRGIAADQNNIGLIARARGDISAARHAFDKALALNRADHRTALAALNLSNLAGLASDVSHFARADSLYRWAIQLQQTAGDSAESAFTFADLGRLQARRGDYSAASSSLSEAARIHDETGAFDDAAIARIELASIQSAMGYPEKASAILDAIDATKQTAPAILAKGVLTRADISLNFGRYAIALRQYNRAQELFRRAQDGSGVAEAQHGRGIVLHIQGDDSAALQLLKRSQSWHDHAGDARSAAIAELAIARLEQITGKRGSALARVSRVKRSMRRIGDPVGEAAAFEFAGVIALEASRNIDAEREFRRGLVLLAGYHAADLRWRLHAGIARAKRDRGFLSEAASEFGKALSAAEENASNMQSRAGRFDFLADKWSTYAELAQLEQRRGRHAAAFAISERLRARQLVDILSRGRLATSRSATEEQDARRRVAELARRIEGDPWQLRAAQPDLGPDGLRSLRRELKAAESDHSRMFASVRTSDPAYSRLLTGATIEARTVRATLQKDEVLLEYLLGDSTCTVFVVSSDGVDAITLPTTRKELRSVIDYSRRSMRESSVEGRSYWRAPLQRLYRDLILPVEVKGHLARKKRIVIVPHAELHAVSFAALIPPQDVRRFLVQRFQIEYAPSATAWIQLAQRRSNVARRRVLALAPHQNALPATRHEMRAIRRAYGNSAAVLTGGQASERALRARLSEAGTVHLATFGVLNATNPLYSFVKLAPTDGGHGRLEVNRVFELGLSGQLVVLSACETALGAGAYDEVPAGDDWIGLVQAFLQGGASRVVASLWPVQDRATAILMERFHRSLAAGNAADEALAIAQREVLVEPATAAPVYWAAFVINGNSARGN